MPANTIFIDLSNLPDTDEERDVDPKIPRRPKKKESKKSVNKKLASIKRKLFMK
jgi:hypothetical protein